MSSAILGIIRHDPWAVLGFVLLGAGGVMTAHIYLTLLRSGYRTPPGAISKMAVRIPLAYLRNRERYGWPAWPAYAVWIFYGGGFVILIVGLTRLPD